MLADSEPDVERLMLMGRRFHLTYIYAYPSTPFLCLEIEAADPLAELPKSEQIDRKLRLSSKSKQAPKDRPHSASNRGIWPFSDPSKSLLSRRRSRVRVPSLPCR